jgi:hypothetical protein
MSTFRPPQVPQQPRTFYTPGQAPGAVPAFSPWAQRAAYQRDRVEVAHLWQQFCPKLTITAAVGAVPPRPWDQAAAYRRSPAQPVQLPPGFVPAIAVSAPGARLQQPARARGDDIAILEEPLPPFVTPVAAPDVLHPVGPWDQRAAYQRDRVEQAHLIELTPDQLTPGAAPAAPIPVGPWDQRGAYQRDRIELAPLIVLAPPPFTAGAAPGAAPAVGPWNQSAAYQRYPPQPLQIAVPYMPGAAPDSLHPVGPWDQRGAYQRDRTELAHQVLLVPPFYTVGAATGVPPPRANDQAAAYQRYPPQPLQITVSFPPLPPVIIVPFAPPQSPARVSGNDLAVLDEPLPGFFTPAAAAAVYVPAPALQIPSVARRDDVAILDEVLPGLLTPPLLTAIAPSRLQLPAPPRRDEIAVLEEVLPFVTPAPITFVPALRLQVPAPPAVRFEFAWQALRPGFVPAPTSVLAITRLEFALAGELARFTLEFEPRAFALPRENRIVGASAEDREFPLDRERSHFKGGND